MRVLGLVSHRRRRTFVGNGSGVSRGDRNRNARLARLRALVPVSKTIVGIDLADRKQMVVVTDHDSKVLARKTFRCRAWDLGVALDWPASRRRRRVSLERRWRASRPTIAGGCWVSWPASGARRSCACSRY